MYTYIYKSEAYSFCKIQFMLQEKMQKNSLVDMEFIALVLSQSYILLGFCFCQVRQLRLTDYLNIKYKISILIPVKVSLIFCHNVASCREYIMFGLGLRGNQATFSKSAESS